MLEQTSHTTINEAVHLYHYVNDGYMMKAHFINARLLYETDFQLQVFYDFTTVLPGLVKILSDIVTSGQSCATGSFPRV